MAIYIIITNSFYMNKLRVLGVCQGQGALLFPLRKHLIGNVEPRGCFHTPNEEQWRINFGDIPFVRKIDQLNLPKYVDIIIGSPNCGTSSILSYSRKKTLGKPKEDESINTFITITQQLQPKVFLMENLPKLLDFITQGEWETLFLDYDLIFHTYSVMEYGNSQKSRVRLTLIGVRKGLSSFKLEAFQRVFKVRDVKFTRELLEDTRLLPKFFPMNGNIRELSSHKVCMYDYRDGLKTKLGLKEIKKLWVGDFKECYKWPINSAKMKTLPGVYRNKPDGYPMTARKQDRQFKPNGEIMSPAELAVIQGYPLKYKIYCIDTDTKERNYWINKGRVSITKGPSYEIGLWFKKCLRKSLLAGV